MKNIGKTREILAVTRFLIEYILNKANKHSLTRVGNLYNLVNSTELNGATLGLVSYLCKEINYHTELLAYLDKMRRENVSFNGLDFQINSLLVPWEERVRILISFYRELTKEANSGILPYFYSDIDSLQYVFMIADGVFAFKEYEGTVEEKRKLTPVDIAIFLEDSTQDYVIIYEDLTEEDISKAISGYYDSVDHIKLTRDDWKLVICECYFEYKFYNK